MGYRWLRGNATYAVYVAAQRGSGSRKRSKGENKARLREGQWATDRAGTAGQHHAALGGRRSMLLPAAPGALLPNWPLSGMMQLHWGEASFTGAKLSSACVNPSCYQARFALVKATSGSEARGLKDGTVPCHPLTSHLPPVLDVFEGAGGQSPSDSFVLIGYRFVSRCRCCGSKVDSRGCLWMFKDKTSCCQVLNYPLRGGPNPSHHPEATSRSF
jgi:hypothetical protein